MKKLLLLLFTGCTTLAMAQLPVSTSAENKNAVLEEFTGIYCTFCPDGHRLAQQFADANPGDVVLINIHTGGYADPNGSDPDFRTQWGAAIAGQSGLFGYPAGTINRRNFPGFEQQGSPAGATAQSRGSWSTTGGTVISEASYANIALEGVIDYANKVLTVDVETYFTAAAPGATVKLNVAVLQNNVQGPQTGMNGNPDQVLPNGNYNHNHMLRELLTGQWGVDIPTATSVVGSYQYTWNIPDEINGIPVSVGELEVVAFITETQQEVVTGAKGPITLDLPAGMSTADVQAVNSMSTATTSLCETSITPEFTIQNNESFAIDSCEAVLYFNGTPTTQWITNIAANSTQVVTFAPQTLVAGSNTISFEVSMNNVAQYIDVVSNNNSDRADDIVTINPNPFSTYHFESFEFYNLGAPAPNNAIQINPELAPAFVVDKNINSSVNWELGGHGNSVKSYRFRFSQISAGTEIDLVFEKLDLSTSYGNSLKFSYAYAQWVDENDALEVLVSQDCGENWTSVWSKAGADLATAPPLSTGDFYPIPSQWADAYIDLNAYNYSPELLVRFHGTSDFGNNVYIDDIKVENSVYISVNEDKMLSTVKVFPNPSSKGYTNVELELTNEEYVSVSLTDLSGKLVASPFEGNLEMGKHRLPVDLSNLEAGVYMAEITIGNNKKVERLVVN